MVFGKGYDSNFQGHFSYYHFAHFFYGASSRLPAIFATFHGLHSHDSIGWGIFLLVAFSLGRGMMAAGYGHWRRQTPVLKDHQWAQTFVAIGLICNLVAYLLLLWCTLVHTHLEPLSLSQFFIHAICFFFLGSAEINGAIDDLIASDLGSDCLPAPRPHKNFTCGSQRTGPAQLHSQSAAQTSWISSMITELGVASAAFFGGMAYVDGLFGLSGIAALAATGIGWQILFMLLVAWGPLPKQILKPTAQKAVDYVAPNSFHVARSSQARRTFFLQAGFALSPLFISSCFAYLSVFYSLTLHLPPWVFCQDFATGCLLGPLLGCLFALFQQSAPWQSSQRRFVSLSLAHALLASAAWLFPEWTSVVRGSFIIGIAINNILHATLGQLLSAHGDALPQAQAYLIRRLANSAFAVLCWLAFRLGLQLQIDQESLGSIPMYSASALLWIWASVAYFRFA